MFKTEFVSLVGTIRRNDNLADANRTAVLYKLVSFYHNSIIITVYSCFIALFGKLSM